MDKQSTDLLVGQTKQAVWIVGRWLLESLSAEQIDRLHDHMNDEQFGSDLKLAIVDQLRLALGYESFGAQS